MAITRKDKKIIFDYLKNAEGGLAFDRILEPEPKPVKRGAVIMLDSVREVESSEDDLLEFWEELKSNGLIRPVDRLNPEWFILTKKGKQVAASEDYNLTLPSLQLDKLVCDAKLCALVQRPFANQDFEDAVFKAFKHLEERVRAKAGLSANEVGASLVTAALHHQRGILKTLNCHTVSEEEGIFMLFKGAIQSFKNPSSHRTVDWNNPQRATQAILLADYLLGVLDNTTSR
jgi:TIGR02391 family protein